MNQNNDLIQNQTSNTINAVPNKSAINISVFADKVMTYQTQQQTSWGKMALAKKITWEPDPREEHRLIYMSRVTTISDKVSKVQKKKNKWKTDTEGKDGWIPYQIPGVGKYIE